MAICIYQQNENDFSTNGLGILQPTDCEVTEEAAGLYEFSMQHPIDSSLRWSNIINGALVKIPCPVRESPLYEISEDVIDPSLSTETQVVQRKIYKANTERMYVRKEPKVNTVKLCSLPHRSEVVLLEHKSGDKWAHIVTVKGGVEGYCPFGGLTYVRTQNETVNTTSATVIGKRVVEIRQHRDQIFRISSVELDSENEMVIATGMHVFYDLRWNILNDSYDVTARDVHQVLSEIGAKLMPESDFTIHADKIDGKITADYGYKNMVEILLDPENGIVKQCNCTLIRDNYDIYLLPNATRDMGVTIRRGKNIRGVNVHYDASNVVTRIIPQGSKSDGKPLFCNPKYFDSPKINDYPKIMPQKIEYNVKTVKSGADNETTFSTDAKSRAKLQQLAEQDFSENGIDSPEYSMDVDFVVLSDTDETDEYSALRSVHMYDTVSVIDEVIHLKSKIGVTGYEWDAVGLMYNSVSLGDLQEIEQTIQGYQIPSSSISGAKLITNSVSGNVIRDATIEHAKISVAAIEQLTAGSIDALIARIQTIIAGSVTTDELYAALAEIVKLKVSTLTADNIQTDTLGAELARIQTLIAGTAEFDRATVTHLVAQALNLEYGVGDQVFINNLAVSYAQMVGATIGELCVKASNGNYYLLDIDASGAVTATQTTVTQGEIDAGQTSSGKAILETNMTVTNLSTSNLLGTYALMNRIDAARIDVDTLLARQAFVDLLYTSKIFGGESLEIVVNKINDLGMGGRNYLRNSQNLDYLLYELENYPNIGAFVGTAVVGLARVV